MIGRLNDLWKLDLGSLVWEILSGNQSIDTLSDYELAYPGGVRSHEMVIDNAKQTPKSEFICIWW